ncbi:methyl-accepting chemotaxis sensory transducer [Clostridium sp. CAG:632]|nr:methyl-accepting chemotaxis sensory transducer [Clostridium sp. CAG:632]
MMKQEDLTEELQQRVQTRINFAHSIRSRILIMIVVTVLICALTVLFTIRPLITKNFSAMQSSYMKDVAMAYGRMLGEYVTEGGLDVVSTPEVQDLLKEISINGKESSYAYVVDLDGTMLYHPIAEKIGVSVENAVVKQMLADIRDGKPQETSVYEYDFRGAIKYAGIYPDVEHGFLLIISADKAEITSDIQSILLKTLFSTLIAFVICVVIALFCSVIITKPIKEMAEIADRFSTLDLRDDDRRERIGQRRDEVGLLGRSIGGVREQFHAIVTEIKTQSNNIHTTAASLDEHTKETLNNIEQVERAVYEIAEGASSQAEDTQKATENVIRMGNMVEDTNQEVENLYLYANAMKQSGDDASKTLSDLEEINHKAKESIDLIYQQTNTTNESALKIREATELITFIAEQTNLLSLNASIEAARAGEQGRGFAVVASQIQKLAEQSNESARQIGEIITLLISDSGKAVDTMNEVMEIMEVQNKNIHQMGRQFEQLFVAIDKSNRGVGNIADRTKSLDEARVNVVDIVQNLTAIAEENAAGTQETSASVTEVNDIVSQISENVNQLRRIAEELEHRMEIFRLDE